MEERISKTEKPETAVRTVRGHALGIHVARVWGWLVPSKSHMHAWFLAQQRWEMQLHGKWGSRLLASARLNPHHCGHLGSDPADGRSHPLFVFLSLSLSNFAFQINKYNWKKSQLAWGQQGLHRIYQPKVMSRCSRSQDQFHGLGVTLTWICISPHPCNLLTVWTQANFNH